jgi:hypothetical protein
LFRIHGLLSTHLIRLPVVLNTFVTQPIAAVYSTRAPSNTFEHPPE